MHQIDVIPFWCIVVYVCVRALWATGLVPPRLSHKLEWAIRPRRLLGSVVFVLWPWYVFVPQTLFQDGVVAPRSDLPVWGLDR